MGLGSRGALSTLYLVVALGVEAVVMLSVLVRAVDVATVLAAREPANRREHRQSTTGQAAVPVSKVQIN